VTYPDDHTRAHPYNRATPYGLLCPHNITEFEGCPDCEGESMEGNYVFEASKKMDIGLPFTTGLIVGHLTKGIDSESALQEAKPVMDDGAYTNEIIHGQGRWRDQDRLVRLLRELG